MSAKRSRESSPNRPGQSAKSLKMALIDRANEALKTDGKIDLDDAKHLCAEVEDGPSASEIEKRTLQYVLDSFELTEEATNFLWEKMRSWSKHSKSERMTPQVHSISSSSSSSTSSVAVASSSSSSSLPQSSVVASSSSGTVEAQTEESKSQSGIIPTIQNVVSTVNLCTPLNLKHIAMRARNAEYNPKRFSAVIMRIREPKTTALVFSSGKMVCTGAKSEELARLASRKYARIIQKLGFPEVRFQDFKIQNIVGSCGVHFPIRLEGLAHEHEDYSTYEPEFFPGLIYRMVSPKIVLLIFVSGKVVLTGAKNRQSIYDAFENIYPVLTEFRKDSD